MNKKLKEGFVASYHYEVPKDPEQLLFDFYFFIGYIFGDSLGNEAEEWALDQALETIVTKLQKHMVKVLKFALSAELRHIDQADCMRYESSFNKLPADMKRFLIAYDATGARYKGSKLLQFDPNVKATKADLEKDRTLSDETDEDHGGGRRDFLTAFQIILDTQKQLGIDDAHLAKIYEECFLLPGWTHSYGGEAWARIAKAMYMILTSTKMKDKIIWLDNAYDLQHNTGTVFTKLKTYYKSSTGYNWIAKALDWKKHATDMHGFYDKVSPKFKRIVAWVSLKKTGKSLEDFNKPNAPKASSKTGTVEKLNTENFIEGEYYAWVGPTDQQELRDVYGWVSAMMPMADGQFRKCIYVSTHQPDRRVEFEDIGGDIYYWYEDEDYPISLFVRRVSANKTITPTVLEGKNFKVGDVITVKKDLEIHKGYGLPGHESCMFARPMAEYKGKKLTVTSFTGAPSGSFTTKEGGSFSWAPSMFEEYGLVSGETTTPKEKPVLKTFSSSSPESFLNVNALKKFYGAHPEQKPLVVKTRGIDEYNEFISFLSKSPYIWKAGQALSEFTPSTAKGDTYIVLTSSIKKIYVVAVTAVGGKTIYTYPKFKDTFEKKGTAGAAKKTASKGTILKEGSYYVWAGPGKRQFTEYTDWNHKGLMDYLLDGKPHLLTKLRERPSKTSALYAVFEGKGDYQAWYWYGAQKYLKEVPAP